MDKNIAETVYNTLEARTEEIGRSIAERDRLEEEIRQKRYSSQALKTEIYPKRNELRRNVRNACESAIQEARNLVAKYRKDAADQENLDPAQLTDDIKLLSPGIVLLPRDIQGMIERNRDNKTMLQIILRYCKENNIDTGGTLYVGGEAEQQTADNLDTIITYYERWIDKRNAPEMLDKFFSIINE